MTAKSDTYCEQKTHVTPAGLESRIIWKIVLEKMPIGKVAIRKKPWRSKS